MQKTRTLYQNSIGAFESWLLKFLPATYPYMTFNFSYEFPQLLNTGQESSFKKATGGECMRRERSFNRQANFLLLYQFAK